jgi:HPt (histidine-containing phosphotransfer) domain-containing protein
LVAAFVGNLPRRMAALRTAQCRSDWREVATLAHQMVGAAGSYGFPELGKVARDIEYHASHHPDGAALLKSISAFNSLCKRAVGGISRRLH